MSRPRALLPLLVVLGALVGAGPAQAAVSTFTLTPKQPQAAGHVAFNFSAILDGAPTKAVRVVLPPGLLGDVAGVPTCSQAQFATDACPAASTVGSSSSQAIVPPAPLPMSATGPIHVLPAQAGEAARLGVTLTSSFSGPIRLQVPVTLAPSFALVSTIPIPSTAPSPIPGGPAVPIQVLGIGTTLDAAAGNGQPFATAPPTCVTATATATASADGTTFGDPDASDSITPQGCDTVPFDPTVAFTTTSKAAGKPTGVTVTLSQPAGTAEQAQSPIASSAVSLPKGLALNLPALAGLTACTQAQFDSDAGCPSSSQMGTVTIDTPAAGRLTGTANLTAVGGVGIFIAADGPAATKAVRLRLRASSGTGDPVVTTLDGLPPTLATRFQLAFTTTATPLFVNPCTATAMGSADLVAASSGATTTVSSSITTTGTCGTTPPTTTSTTPATTPTPTPTTTTPATTGTTPPATTETTPTSTTPAQSTPVLVPAPTPTTTSTAGGPTTTVAPAKARTKLRISQQRLKGRRVRVRTLVLAGSARCDGTVRVTVNVGTRGKRLARRTVKLPASCLVRTTFKLPRAAAGKRVSSQVALRGATQLRDATARTRTAKISRG